MKAYKIVYRNYVVGADAIEHSVIVQGWIRKCITIADLERNNKIIVSAEKVDIQ